MSVSESPRPLKRDHDSFESSFGLEEPYPVPPEYLAKLDSEDQKAQPVQQPTFSLPMPPAPINTSKRDPSPSRSNSGSVLSDVGPVTPSYASTPPAPNNTASPSAFAALDGSAPPPAKKAKLTFAEKEVRRIQKEFKDQERAAEKAKREADRQSQAEEKARKDAEKEAERKKKEAEREEKKAAQEAEKAAKEEKRRKKEEDKLRAEEEKRKKERSQRTLGSFFNIPAAPTKSRSGSVGSRERSSMSPAPQNSNPSLGAPSPAPNKSKKTTYDKLFPEFFIHHDVKVAAINRFERDEEATETIIQTIDSYLLGNKSPVGRSFDATELFHLLGTDSLRGKRCIPVREIMTELSGKAERPIDLTTNSQNSQIKKKHDLLKQVPMKFLCFKEDVRPPYRGTYTKRPVNGIPRLARNPLRKELPNTDYDYDSEAEWVEDEDAEDCNSDGEEEEDAEDGEDMEGFLDDEHDEMHHSKRMVIQGDLEPVSTGLCWENGRKKNTSDKMFPYRMEIIIDPKLKSIDPLSTTYWSPHPTSNPAMDPPRIPLTTLKTSNSLPFSSSNKPVKPLSFLPQPSTQPKDSNNKSKKLLPPEDIPRFKAAVEGQNLSKVGLIEVLKKQFPNATGAAVKGTLESVARRVGAKEVDKRWVIVEGM
ncbi:Chromatin assembly factor 1 subunit [Lachnellula hyalina]|uniref:Chromatin assembly factor 1 subunit n=1 Tax=Lachnellula hyalina TaxID=1316788 RepID=A0A8H8U0M4_9HELO|nr:Chromatin assembly factor 1 subunit [Lachnellula hyalina]TVY29082.1 Chromatin assembly factor 1 subunit [Lachnellula hyalina]